MFAVGPLVTLSSLITGFLFGKLTRADLLSGALVSSVQIADNKTLPLHFFLQLG